MKAIFNQYINRLYTSNPITEQDRSVIWFRENVRLLDSAGIRNLSISTNDVEKAYPDASPNVERGYIYLFAYNPLTAKQLKYYDTFPLVIPFYEQGMMFKGLNLHYLPYEYRATLMDKLLTFTTNKTYTDDMKLSVVYSLIKDFSYFKEVKPCIKQYYKHRMKSNAMRVDTSDWNSVLFLPLERFKKQSLKKVWADSVQTIKGI